MGDVGEILTDVGLNLVTGGLYSVGKGVAKTIESGNPMDLLAQGLDLGMAGLGNDIAREIGGDGAGIAYNMAGLGAGLAGGGAAGLSPSGFGAESGVAPLAATPAFGGVGVPASGSSVVGAVTGQAPTATLGSVGAPASGSSLIGSVTGQTPAVTTPSLASSVPSTLTPEITSEITGAAPSLNSAASAKGWFESLSPGAQTAMITGGMVGGQMLTGAMGGLFAGVSAQKKLELEQLINQQRENQVQLTNKNNSYAPLLTFKQPGMINAPIVGTS